MKTIILCGGKGTRMKEETEFKPKPMVLVGGKPILWHIMKQYAHFGYKDFVLALGYKGNLIKDYFLHERQYLNDFSFKTSTGEISFKNKRHEDFTITFVETGEESLSGERVLRCRDYVKDDELFMVTYGDGLSTVDIRALVDFHKKQGTVATITGVHPDSKYGLLTINKEDCRAREFREKPRLSDYINGGFMVFNQGIFEYLDTSEFENVFPKLVKDNELSVRCHEGFWKGVDTYKDVETANKLWETQRVWKLWS